jgi:hypothetical protein
MARSAARSITIETPAGRFTLRRITGKRRHAPLIRGAAAGERMARAWDEAVEAARSEDVSGAVAAAILDRTVTEWVPSEEAARHLTPGGGEEMERATRAAARVLLDTLRAEIDAGAIRTAVLETGGTAEHDLVFDASAKSQFGGRLEAPRLFGHLATLVQRLPQEVVLPRMGFVLAEALPSEPIHLHPDGTFWEAPRREQTSRLWLVPRYRARSRLAEVVANSYGPPASAQARSSLPSLRLVPGEVEVDSSIGFAFAPALRLEGSDGVALAVPDLLPATNGIAAEVRALVGLAEADGALHMVLPTSRLDAARWIETSESFVPRAAFLALRRPEYPVPAAVFLGRSTVSRGALLAAHRLIFARASAPSRQDAMLLAFARARSECNRALDLLDETLREVAQGGGIPPDRRERLHGLVKELRGALEDADAPG